VAEVTPFAKFARTLDYPLYVVTTAADGERSGCLIGFATQCSIRPPRFLACLSKKNHTYELALRAGTLAVHRIEKDRKALAELFGGETGDEVDKFAQVAWHEAHGVPVLQDCASWFAGTILERIDLGDHMGFLLDPVDARPAAGAGQLTYQQARDIEAGHKA
jgi:flavin reductase (DIM6/NTAB) family NADH-FMN oxidoreductase RutF